MYENKIYQSNGRMDILRELDMVEGNVIDIGAGNGEFGYKLLGMYPNIRKLVMVEPYGNLKMSYADTRVKIIPEKFENMGDIGLYDYIFLNDVLEHVADPWSFFKKVEAITNDKSVIYVSLPNIQQLPVIMGLIKGEFRYEEYGILDKTHLRFYTRKSALDFFKSFGYSSIKVQGLNFGFFYPNIKTYGIRKIITLLSRCFPFFRDYMYQQYFFTIRK